MATINTTAVTNILKQVYGKRITDLFARQKQTYNEFAKSSREYQYVPGGAGYYFALRQSDIESVGARLEDAYIPEPLAAGFIQGLIKPRFVYASLRLSGPAVESGRSNVMAFANVQGDAIMSTYQALITDLNRMAWGDGFGKLGEISEEAEPSLTETWTAKFDNATGVRYIRKGMVCDFYSSGGEIDESASSVRVSSVNAATKVVTFEAHSTAPSYRSYHPDTDAQKYTGADDAIPAGSHLVRYGARDDNLTTSDTNREMMGLLGCYDDGTRIEKFENVEVDAYPEWKANILSNSSVDRELSIDLMLAACDMTATRSTETVGKIRMGLGQRRKYFGLLSPDIRFAPAELKGGYEVLQFSQDAAIDMVIDPYCPPGKMFFEPLNAIRKYELTPIGWGGMDEQKWHWREMYDQATAFLRLYTELGVENRPALTLLEDLNEPTGATMPY
jgi:hypothetical protein